MNSFLYLDNLDEFPRNRMDFQETATHVLRCEHLQLRKRKVLDFVSCSHLYHNSIEHMVGRNFFFHWYHQATLVESRPLIISPNPEKGYERQQLVWDVIELFKDVDARLLQSNIDRYLVLKLKLNNDWIVIPPSVRNVEQFLSTFEVDSNIIEGSLQFIDQVELKYLVNEFSSQIIDAAVLSDTVYYNTSDLSPTPLEVPLEKSPELSSFDVIYRSEHYLEFTRGLKYFMAQKNNRLYIAFRGSAAMQNWFDNANLISDSFESQGHVHRGFYELAKCINIDYLYSILEKVRLIFSVILLCTIVSFLVNRKCMIKLFYVVIHLVELWQN
jgi:hypothetical protein